MIPILEKTVLSKLPRIKPILLTVEIMGQWNKKSRNGKRERKKKQVSLAVIAANNHYAGFGLGTSNLFRKMVGFSELSWADQQQQQQIQERLRLGQQQQEQNVEISSSNMSSNNHTEKRQSSLTEFIE